MPQSSAVELARARALLADARRIVVLTGAGVSAESGVPTFRGNEGLWRRFRPEELATPEAFARDPGLVWAWYAWRRERIAGCAPNAAHRALAELALERQGVSLVTQNVDGLHGRAADDALARRREAGEEPPPERVAAARPLELHGSILRDRCSRCETRAEPRAPSGDDLPRCAACGGLLRPDVVWFGEMLDSEVLEAASSAAAEADVCLVVGTSAVVHPAAGLAHLTRRGGGRVIEVNPEETPLTAAAEVSLRGRAAELVPALTGHVDA